jgi:hypothetical protein
MCCHEFRIAAQREGSGKNYIWQMARRNGIKDFILPVAIDDLPSAEYNVYLSLRQGIGFFPSWRDGLLLLLKKLSRDRVPRRKRRFNPQNVANWWRSYRSS